MRNRVALLQRQALYRYGMLKESPALGPSWEHYGPTNVELERAVERFHNMQQRNVRGFLRLWESFLEGWEAKNDER